MFMSEIDIQCASHAPESSHNVPPLWCWSLPAIAVFASVLLTVIYHPNDQRKADAAQPHRTVPEANQKTAPARPDDDPAANRVARIEMLNGQPEAKK